MQAVRPSKIEYRNSFTAVGIGQLKQLYAARQTLPPNPSVKSSTRPFVIDFHDFRLGNLGGRGGSSLIKDSGISMQELGQEGIRRFCQQLLTRGQEVAISVDPPELGIIRYPLRGERSRMRGFDFGKIDFRQLIRDV